MRGGRLEVNDAPYSVICPPKFCVAVPKGIENNAYAQFLGVSKDVQVAYSLDHLLKWSYFFQTFSVVDKGNNASPGEY